MSKTLGKIAVHSIAVMQCNAILDALGAQSKSNGIRAMPYYFQIIWDEESDDSGNVQHIAEHALVTDDTEYVLNTPESEGTSQSSGLPCCFGYTDNGRYIIVVYELIGDDSVYPVTAYDVPEPA